MLRQNHQWTEITLLQYTKSRKNVNNMCNRAWLGHSLVYQFPEFNWYSARLLCILLTISKCCPLWHKMSSLFQNQKRKQGINPLLCYKIVKSPMNTEHLHKTIKSGTGNANSPMVSLLCNVIILPYAFIFLPLIPHPLWVKWLYENIKPH